MRKRENFGSDDVRAWADAGSVESGEDVDEGSDEAKTSCAILQLVDSSDHEEANAHDGESREEERTTTESVDGVESGHGKNDRNGCEAKRCQKCLLGACSRIDENCGGVAVFRDFCKPSATFANKGTGLTRP